VNPSQHALEGTANHSESLDGWKCHPSQTEPPTGLLRLWVPQPAPWLNSNDRRHRMAQAKITKAWREAAADAARGHGRFDQPVRIVATIWKSRLGDYDAGNLYPTAKACVDGFRDVKLLIEDNNRYVVGPDMRHGGKGEPGLFFLFTELL
jgi:crossover junction endodeoxyribonuclease RusA